MAKLTTRRVLFTSFIVDTIDVVVNTIVAIITGSAVMLVEALQGLADLCSIGLLLIGNKRSRRRANKLHPFGYGKEKYFWATMSGFIILMITATASFYFGYQEFVNHTLIENIGWAYAVLGMSVLTNGYAFRQSSRKILKGQPFYRLPKAFMESWQIAPKMACVLDAMGTAAAVLGLTSLLIYGLTGLAQFDGLGAMIVAVVLALFAILLLVGLRSLITGRSAPVEIQQSIETAALSVSAVKEVLELETMLLGEDDILANLEVHLEDDLTTDQIEKVIDDIKLAIGRSVPGQRIKTSVEPETPSRWIGKKVV